MKIDKSDLGEFMRQNGDCRTCELLANGNGICSTNSHPFVSPLNPGVDSERLQRCLNQLTEIEEKEKKHPKNSRAAISNTTSNARKMYPVRHRNTTPSTPIRPREQIGLPKEKRQELIDWCKELLSCELIQVKNEEGHRVEFEHMQNPLQKRVLIYKKWVSVKYSRTPDAIRRLHHRLDVIKNKIGTEQEGIANEELDTFFKNILEDGPQNTITHLPS